MAWAATPRAFSLASTTGGDSIAGSDSGLYVPGDSDTVAVAPVPVVYDRDTVYTVEYSIPDQFCGGVEVSGIRDTETKSVVIADRVATSMGAVPVVIIAPSAFAACTSLARVEIPVMIRAIGARAFDCPGLSVVICNAQEPPVCGESAFGAIAPATRVASNATLYVSEGSEDAYRSADVWRDFPSIKPISEAPAGVGIIAAPTTSASAIKHFDARGNVMIGNYNALGQRMK